MGARVELTQSWKLPWLLRGEPDYLVGWVKGSDLQSLFRAVFVILIGAGLYGGAMGSWRSPVQAGWVALKFPLILLLTTAGNTLLNGMLAPLLGLRAPWRASLAAILMSFVIAAAILGSFSPLIFFLVWNCPDLDHVSAASGLTYPLALLLHTGVIALAGITANLRLAQLLRRLSGSTRVARRVLLAWLIGNLFLGSQICWILRPFIGSPALPVQFMRPNALEGNFYEAILRSAAQVLYLRHG